MRAYPYDLSIVIPLLNEEESLPELMQWIDKVCTAHQYNFEVLFVDDGSTDGSWVVIQKLAQKYPSKIRGIRFQRNYGKSAALKEGFAAANGKVVITMDADLQDSPDEIPELMDMILIDQFDLVSGWKKVRYDNAVTKNLPSKFFNAVTRFMSGIKLHDFNCGLKAYHNKVVKSVEVYGEMHRYIPVLAKSAGFKNIGEKVVLHRPRKYGISKFGWERFINGFLDLMSLQFMSRFGKKPMHFFGLWGSLVFLMGFIATLYLIISKIIGGENVGLTNSPLFYLALVSMVIGTQFFLAGFVAELISRSASDKDVYLIDEKLGFD